MKSVVIPRLAEAEICDIEFPLIHILLLSAFISPGRSRVVPTRASGVESLCLPSDYRTGRMDLKWKINFEICELCWMFLPGESFQDWRHTLLSLFVVRPPVPPFSGEEKSAEYLRSQIKKSQISGTLKRHKRGASLILFCLVRKMAQLCASWRKPI